MKWIFISVLVIVSMTNSYTFPNMDTKNACPNEELLIHVNRCKVI